MRKLTQSDDKSKIWYFLNWFIWLYVTEYFSALLDITMRKMTQSDDKSKKWHFINGFGYIKQDIFQRYSIAQWENDTKWRQIEIVLMSSMPWRQITTYNRAICHPPYCLKRPHNGFKKNLKDHLKLYEQLQVHKQSFICSFKVYVVWKGHKILRNIHIIFVYSTYRQK